MVFGNQICSYKISSPALPSLLPIIMDTVQQNIAEKQNSPSLLSQPNEKKGKRDNKNEKAPACKAIKIRLCPTKDEQKKLRNVFGYCR